MNRGKVKKNPKREGLFWLSGNNRGLACPFKPITCEKGYCEECQIYLDWQKLGQIVVVCAWCSKEISRNSGLGNSGVAHGICLECQTNYFPNTLGGTE